jgi:ribosomal protein S18 acetylase RimI-like enzyme
MTEGDGYKIQPARVSDAARLSELVNSAYRGDYSRQGWTTEADLLDGTRTDAVALKEILTKPGTTILTYVERDTILGCVELVLAGKDLYLGMLTVEPALQGRGTGKLLLQAAEKFGVDHHCSKIHMTVISVRTELIQWYMRHGYADTGKRKPFAFNDPRFGQPRQPLEFMVMEKKLSRPDAVGTAHTSSRS